jgi:ribonuclease HII|uniref:Ribonuclease HII n=1 Tax=viral metagenome TaxID=1070528 RepID=A0A6C0ISJ1_9ZZZZ
MEIKYVINLKNKYYFKLMLRVAHFKNKIEAGIDEAGRGPLLGRVYAAAVILNPDMEYDGKLIKDSKKLSSKKILESEQYVKDVAIDWAVAYSDETRIDDINILHATQEAMHKAIDQLNVRPDHLLVDGNYFSPYKKVNSMCVVKGDSTYFSIAAASILAKTARDRYIQELCIKSPDLDNFYGIKSNKGYGSKGHMDGIKRFGISKYHRKTFGICKISKLNKLIKY